MTDPADTPRPREIPRSLIGNAFGRYHRAVAVPTPTGSGVGGTGGSGGVGASPVTDPADIPDPETDPDTFGDPAAAPFVELDPLDDPSS